MFIFFCGKITILPFVRKIEFSLFNIISFSSISTSLDSIHYYEQFFFEACFSKITIYLTVSSQIPN